MEEKDEKKEIIIKNWVKLLMNTVTDCLLSFYKIQTPLLNFIKILIILEKLHLVDNQNPFFAQDHLYFAIKCAGYAYLKESDESKRLLDQSFYGGSERLKLIV